MHITRAERPAVVVIAALIVGLLAHTCVFTPYQPISFGKRGTVLSATAASGAQLPGNREGKSGLFGLVESPIAVWSLEPIVAGAVVRPLARDARRDQFRRAPLSSRPPPITL